MAPRHPPRFVVRTLDDAARERRRRLFLGVGWALSVVVALLLGGWFGGRGGSSRPADRSASHQATAETEELRQQVANLERASQVGDVATKELKRNLAERDEEISGLRTDLDFYSRLVGGDGQRQGLRIQGARGTKVDGSKQAWNLVVTLTQNARRGDLMKGSLHLAIEGIQANKVVTLEGPTLGQSGDLVDQPFSFKYFQQVQTSFTLPTGFQPARL
ncbi:MAG: hypothetical protein GAK28_01571 [Luteibacter sp.]|uniref:DUF6776 family protein n=1 Tax=Luteibacter sp. TaxID=1886636 RepID=UPI0013844C45|nr:DUF6776 family protein [Luteibacter sp.]KAF1007615.1 MAG: hypothetical protein GAK28_01571 [Luteibacter sp.]